MKSFLLLALLLPALNTTGIELTFGNDASPSQADAFKALGVTSVESYVDWAGVEPEEGRWDWSKWDHQVAILNKTAGLKWVPFLIAGPAYATPLWFQRGPNSHYLRCLEHGKESKIQSIFNPDFRPWVSRFLQAFAERYGNSGVIESVLIGVTGVYGESIYPANKRPGDWTTRLTGEYHSHHGWWAGDSDAGAAFRKAMQNKYHSLTTLNLAWGTHYNTFTEVMTVMPEKAINDRMRDDFVEWYQQAMTDWAVFWVAETRKAFPQTEIYLCTGGDGNPQLGADFTAQAKAIAPFGAGIRITNEGSDYTTNFSLTREAATATRHYGTFCGFEPAGAVTVAGLAARIYNAAASGVRQLHFYTDNVLGSPERLQNFRANTKWLMPRQPSVDVAYYLSRETWALAPDAIGRTYQLSRRLRELVDHDYVTRQSVTDGALQHYRVLILAESPVLEPRVAAAIEHWVEAGGVLIAVDPNTGTRLYDNTVWQTRLFGMEKETDKHIGKGRSIMVDKSILQNAIKPFVHLDGQHDGRFVTRCKTGSLWFDAAKTTIVDDIHSTSD